MSENARIVITGIGVVSPCGIGKKRLWDSVIRGRSAIRPIAGFRIPKLPSRMAGEVPSFNIGRLLGKKRWSYYSRSAQFALVASGLALDDAGLVYPVPDRVADHYGVCLGISVGSIERSTELHAGMFLKGPRFIDPFVFPNTTPNMSAGHISMMFNIKGFNTTLSSHSSSGIDAVSYASDMIKHYGYGFVLAGAAEELTDETFTGLSRVKCTSGFSCPYDRRRKGLIPGEGSCIFVLEELSQARRRKAGVYAEVKGCGSSFDPRTKHGFSAAADGATRAMRQAIIESGCRDSEIDCVIGSANSTRGGDRTEARAIERVFKKHSRKLYKIHDRRVF